MSDLVLKWYLRLFDTLSPEYKAELIKKLVDRMHFASDRNSHDAEEERRAAKLKKLVGTWKNLDIEGDVVVGSRTASDRLYDL